MTDVNTNEKECANDSRAVQFRRRQSPNTIKLRAMQPGRKGEGDDVQRYWNDHLSPLPLSGALQPAFQYNTASLHSIDTAAPQAHPTIDSVHVHSPSSPSSAGLRLQTDVLARFQPPSLSLASSNPIEPQLQQPIFVSPLPHRSSSVRSSLSAAHFTGGSLSPASAVSSPGLGPILDITPLPSPITAWGSPRRSLDSQESRDLPPEIARIPTPMGSSQEFLNFTRTSSKKWRSKPTFIAPAKAMFGRETQIYDVKASTHARNRSISDYAPDPAQILRNCHVVVSGTGSSLAELPLVSPNQFMHREEYLAIQRGLTSPDPKPPTPPRSNRDTEGSDLGSGSRSPGARKGSLPLRYEARTVRGNQLKQWKAVRQLGKGTFSTVMLAVSSENVGGEDAPGQSAESNQASTQEKQEGPAQRGRLVAVKICEYGPAGGADEKKVETSLKRELEILKAIDHPSLVHLKAFNVLDRRAYIILNYCAGGDLFELANFKPELLIPGLIRRIFTELVGAVQYLHAQYIVHRDIKLENVLVNLPTETIGTISNWQTYPLPLITLTDLGLGRWIPKPPESPLLETRCGSEDYAAPEILLGQSYDGRATDAWALGVLLYSLMEGRLPFDPIPSTKRKSLKSHRIARCEWTWLKWGNEDGKWNSAAVKGEPFEGARTIVEGLLLRSRSRWPLDKVAETVWVQQGIMLSRPLRRADEDDDDDESLEQ